MVFIEYIKIFLFLVASLLLVLTLVMLPKLFNKKFVWKNTYRPVECGSQSFGSGKNKIEIIFYRVLIIFIVFEIEVLIMIPWAFNFYLTFEYSSFFLLVFFIILLIGYVYEYIRGVFRF